MRKLFAASASAAALTIALAAPAFADCASEIQALKSQEFTGSVAAQGGGAGGAMAGQDAMATQGGVQAGNVELTPSDKMDQSGAQASGPAGSSDVNVAAQKAGETSETEATPAMNAAVGQSAASPQDVQQQMAGKPTAAQEAQASIAAGGGTSTDAAQMPAGNGAQAEFGVLIQQAENYQKLGNEEACMNVIKQAKGATTTQ